MHVAGEGILTPELLILSCGNMLALSDGIKTIEGILIKEKYPNYPVFTRKVLSDVEFVHEAPAAMFFIVYEDASSCFSQSGDEDQERANPLYRDSGSLLHK